MGSADDADAIRFGCIFDIDGDDADFVLILIIFSGQWSVPTRQPRTKRPENYGHYQRTQEIGGGSGSRSGIMNVSPRSKAKGQGISVRGIKWYFDLEKG